MNIQDIKIFFDRPIAFQPALARLVGSVAGGLFLSQALYWRGVVDKTNPERGGWFYKTAGEWQGETALTRSEQDRARRDLERLKILSEEKKGIPCLIWYRVDLERLADLLNKQASMGVQQTSLQDPAHKLAGSDKQDCGILPTSSQNPATYNTEITSSEITTKTIAETTHTQVARVCVIPG